MEGNGTKLQDATSSLPGTWEYVANLFADGNTNTQATQQRLLHLQKMEALGQFVGAFAHELSNILTAINGGLELFLAEKNPNDIEFEYLRLSMQAGQDARNYIMQLLSLGRKLPDQYIYIDLNQAVEQTVALIRQSMNRRITIELMLQKKNLSTILADPVQIRLLLTNLLINACDALQESYQGEKVRGKDTQDMRLEITVKTRKVIVSAEDCEFNPDARQGEFVRLSVEDTGCGISIADQREVLTPFFTTKGHKGTGLGLTTVLSVANAHDGWIEFSSSPGYGTTFEVFLPAQNVDAVKESALPSLKECPEGEETILLIDDEIQILYILKRSMVNKGYRVITANNGLAGLDAYQRNRRDVKLVVMDLNMPGLSGEELLERVFQLEPDARVIITSGIYFDCQSLNILNGKISVFLHKPFLPSELLSVMRQVLDLT